MENLRVDIFNMISNQWGLLAAGNADGFNAMTVSWGSLGVLWSKSVVTVYVKPIRYTSEFLNREEYFTLSFFTEKYRDNLKILGTYSGRDCDKLAMTALTPSVTDKGVVFAEAERTFLCRKIYCEPMKSEKIPVFAAEAFYREEEPHYIYIGEVVEIIDRTEERETVQKAIKARCFGSFEVFADESPISFRRTKTKEALAYLIDRRGAVVSSRELCAALWEDKSYDGSTANYLHQLMSDLRRGLKKLGAENVLVRYPQGYAVDVNTIDCDYYRLLDGDADAVRRFTGEYMSNYSWSEYTGAFLQRRYRKQR